MMQKILPHPLMSVTLALVWLLLVNTVNAGHVLLGVLFGVLIPMFTNAFWPERPHLAKPGKILIFSLHLLYDIIVSNLIVARQILSPRLNLHPDFVEYPVEIENEFAITILASVIALTPGTVAAGLSEDRRMILIHGLNVTDKAVLVKMLKERYELPLMEIFPPC